MEYLWWHNRYNGCGHMCTFEYKWHNVASWELKQFVLMYDAMKNTNFKMNVAKSKEVVFGGEVNNHMLHINGNN